MCGTPSLDICAHPSYHHWLTSPTWKRNVSYKINLPTRKPLCNCLTISVEIHGWQILASSLLSHIASSLASFLTKASSSSTSVFFSDKAEILRLKDNTQWTDPGFWAIFSLDKGQNLFLHNYSTTICIIINLTWPRHKKKSKWRQNWTACFIQEYF